MSALVWQAVANADATGGSITLAARVFSAAGMNETRHIAGPYAYSGDVPNISSVAVSPSGEVAVAVVSDVNVISVFRSTNGGLTFAETKLPTAANTLLSPRIFALSDGGFIVFASQGFETTFVLLYSRLGRNGRWSVFVPFPAVATNAANPFAPTVLAYQNTDIVVYQATHAYGRTYTYQLFATVSKKGSDSWSKPVLISDKVSFPTVDDDIVVYGYHNQHPSLFSADGHISLAWERTSRQNDRAALWTAELTSDGSTVTLIPGSAAAVTDAVSASGARFFTYNHNRYLIWTDVRTGIEQVQLAWRNGVFWESLPLPRTDEASAFALPLFPLSGSAAGHLYLAWQHGGLRNGVQIADGAIALLVPDETVPPPEVTPLGFVVGRPYQNADAAATVTLQSDSSGMAGFAWIWTQDPSAVPPTTVTNLPYHTRVADKAIRDGIWYFKVRAVDYAGNWSETVSLPYLYDSTPPGVPSITLPDLDGNGAVAGNTFAMHWTPPPSGDAVRYTWSLERVASLPPEVAESPHHPMLASSDETRDIIAAAIAEALQTTSDTQVPDTLTTGDGTRTESAYRNVRNGIYRFNVAAIDEVGNVSSPATAYMALNKHVPTTIITKAVMERSAFGLLSLTVAGSGFTYDGTVTELYLDADGEAPYDMVLNAADGGFTIESDSRLSATVLKDLRDGDYYVGVLHSDRGFALTSTPLLTISFTGTIKFYNYHFALPWNVLQQHPEIVIQMTDVLFWSAIVLALLGTILAAHALRHAFRDTMRIRDEISAY